MRAPTIQELEADPDFKLLSPADQDEIRQGYVKTWVLPDPDYQMLSPAEQAKVVDRVLRGPPSPPPLIERPRTGANLTPPRDAGGLGELTIVNGMAHDAEIKLVSIGGGLSRHVFVRAHDRHTLHEIHPDSYQLLFRTGEDWDKRARRFIHVRGVSKFDKVFDWKEVSTAEGIQYGELIVTLHPVPDGNVRTSSIKNEDFDRIQ